MLKEIIEHNKLTLVFQNSERLRTGKFYRRTTADLSVQWVLDAFRNMPAQADKLVIVPVMTSYDRIFEMQNLTSEMVKGVGHNLSFVEYMKRIYTFRKDQLGEVFVKYLEPIHVKSFMGSRGVEEAAAGASFALSSELYMRQQHATPVTLNSLVAACLLQERSETMQL